MRKIMESFVVFGLWWWRWQRWRLLLGTMPGRTHAWSWYLCRSIQHTMDLQQNVIFAYRIMLAKHLHSNGLWFFQLVCRFDRCKPPTLGAVFRPSSSGSITLFATIRSNSHTPAIPNFRCSLNLQLQWVFPAHSFPGFLHFYTVI